MTTSIGAVLRSTGLAKIDRALLARAEKPRVKVWAGSIAVGHEKRAKAYTPIRNARQMREMIEAAKLYERQTLAQRRTTTPRIRNGAIGQAGIQIIEFLARVIDYSTGALFPSLHTIMEGTGLSKNCVVQTLSRLKEARIIDWFRRYEPVPDQEAQGAGPRIKQATNAYRFPFPAFLSKIFAARRRRGQAAHAPVTARARPHAHLAGRRRGPAAAGARATPQPPGGGGQRARAERAAACAVFSRGRRRAPRAAPPAHTLVFTGTRRRWP